MKDMTRLRLNNLKSVNNLIARTINSLIDETISVDEARAIGYLANILYGGIDKANNEELKIAEQKARIENIEMRTKSLDSMTGEIEDVRYLHEMFGTMPKVIKGGKE